MQINKKEKYEVEVRVNFRYGHRLLPPYVGKCTQVHGEGGILILIFESNKLDENGMVLDFGVVKKDVKLFVDTKLDHTYLYKKGDEVGEFLKEKGYNIFEMEGNPTAENIAKIVYDAISKIYPQLKKVGSIESFEDSIAWYEKNKDYIEVENFKPYFDETVKELSGI